MSKMNVLEKLPLLFQYSLIYLILYPCAYAHIHQAVIFSRRVNTVGEENIGKLIFGVGPDAGACKALVAKTLWRSEA
jgi:hypothetical protein